MTTVAFKACQKCGGDMFFEKDNEGKCWNCLQCGHEVPAYGMTMLISWGGDYQVKGGRRDAVESN